MIINLRFLIALLAIVKLTTLIALPVQADWFHNEAKSRIAASLLA